jgi:transposase
MIRLMDEQWKRIRKHFPEEHIPDGRPGRKPIPTRHVLEAVLWILNTGAQWHMLPQSYPNYKTVHRRFPQWRRTRCRSAARSCLKAADHGQRCSIAPQGLQIAVATGHFVRAPLHHGSSLSRSCLKQEERQMARV